MNSQETTKTINELTSQTRKAASQMDHMQRATMLRELVEAVYDSIKFDNPEGSGLDGRDGPERRGVGKVADAAKNYFYEALQTFAENQQR